MPEVSSKVWQLDISISRNSENPILICGCEERSTVLLQPPTVLTSKTGQSPITELPGLAPPSALGLERHSALRAEHGACQNRFV